MKLFIAVFLFLPFALFAQKGELARFSLCHGVEVEHALASAKEAGAIVSLELADPELITQFRERLWAAISSHVDILLATEEEAYALSQLPPREAALFLKNFCQVAVINVGEKGCWVCSKEGVFHSNQEPSSQAILNFVDTR